MKPVKIFLTAGFFLCCVIKNINAQRPVNTTAALDARQQAIVTISAFTAKGDPERLKQSLNEGLDAGLPVNEVKEILVQLYAYAGFPRSLNALTTLMAVVKERTGKGIRDAPGREPSPFSADKTKLQTGTELQTALVGQPVKGEVYTFAPAIDRFLKEHLFGDIFGRDNLDWKTRELATISALAAFGGVEGQLRSHFGVGLYNGLTGAQLTEVVTIIQTQLGDKEGKAAGEALQSVLKAGDNNTAIITTADIKTEGTRMMMRIAEIEIYPDSLDKCKAILKEEAAASVRLEPGVISIFPMQQRKDTTRIRILEIYANREAYEAHLKTPHFQRYKTATLKMVKSLGLVDMDAIDPQTMKKMFTRTND